MRRSVLAGFVVVAAFAAVGAVAAVTPMGVGSGAPADDPGAAPSGATDAPGPNGTTIDHEGDRLVLKALQNRTVGGETDLAPGTELTVRLTSTGSASPFLRTATTTVAEDGTYAAEFDLRGVANGTTFDVVVRHDGAREANATGTVVGGNNDYEPPEPENSSEWTEVSDDGDDSEGGPNATVYHDGDAVTLASAANQTVRGETEVEPGSELVVRLKSTDAENPFLRTAAVTVREDGTFAATFDMTTTDPGTAFEVVVRQDGTRLTTEDGTVTDTDG